MARIDSLSSGRHKAELVLEYESPNGDKTIRRKASFFAIPIWVFWPATISLVVLVLLTTFVLDKKLRVDRKKYRPKHLRG